MEIMEQINQFVDERNWRQYHNAKDLAISISIEAAELLEIYQWRKPDEVPDSEQEHLKEEIADVLIYTMMLADTLGFDIEEIIAEKIKKNAIKYPVTDQ